MAAPDEKTHKIEVGSPASKQSEPRMQTTPAGDKGGEYEKARCNGEDVLTPECSQSEQILLSDPVLDCNDPLLTVAQVTNRTRTMTMSTSREWGTSRAFQLAQLKNADVGKEGYVLCRYGMLDHNEDLQNLRLTIFQAFLWTASQIPV
jgi:hypothetical protein